MRRRVVGFGVVTATLVSVLVSLVAAPASSASPPVQRVLAANHHLSAKPGGGHGGGGGGGGSTWPGWASSNWSGYAVRAGSYTGVTGQWSVPAAAPTQSSTYSAAWIGIGGFTTADLIQTGTESDFVNGHPEYAAWWTTSDLGYAEQPIDSLTVKAGDAISASVVNNGDGTWTMTLTDGGNSFSKVVSFSSSETSAEWIMEAPGIGGRTAPLANYGTDTFDPSSVTVTTATKKGTSSQTESPGFTVADGGILIQKRAIVSIPSIPDPKADGFVISYGSQQPQPPST
ncbi:MAG TPA: G1 family glutamic endopeptidase [Mycobacteriales bacterium]|nr:G1 family glutamic endopeptidase [Mycobacteriales bacterium]